MPHDSNEPHTPQHELQSDDYSTANRLSRAWDASYQKEKYVAEPALGFADDIIKELKTRPNLMNGRGLYAGCGNGRNYVPLAEAGLNMIGLDISRVALNQLSKRLQRCSNLVCGDFLDYSPDVPFQYLIAIQSFQHGGMSRAMQYFAKASSLLEDGGMLFLRVNASDTQAYHKHDIIEKNEADGFTVRYSEGPKKGLDVRFFSKKDMLDLAGRNGMSIISRLRKVTTERALPGMGSWSQWELIAKKG